MNHNDNAGIVRDLFDSDDDNKLSQFIYIKGNDTACEFSNDRYLRIGHVFGNPVKIFNNKPNDRTPSERVKKRLKSRKIFYDLYISQVPWISGRDADVQSGLNKKTLIKVMVKKLRLVQNNTAILAHVIYQIQELSPNNTFLEFEKDVTIPIPIDLKVKSIRNGITDFSFKKVFIGKNYRWNTIYTHNQNSYIRRGSARFDGPGAADNRGNAALKLRFSIPVILE